jgi:hypothetical protein
MSQSSETEQLINLESTPSQQEARGSCNTVLKRPPTSTPLGPASKVCRTLLSIFQKDSISEDEIFVTWSDIEFNTWYEILKVDKLPTRYGEGGTSIVLTICVPGEITRYKVICPKRYICTHYSDSQLSTYNSASEPMFCKYLGQTTNKSHIISFTADTAEHDKNNKQRAS